jgi:hypothetical protein
MKTKTRYSFILQSCIKYYRTGTLKLIAITLVLSVYSCIEAYDVNFSNSQPKLVVDAQLVDIDTIHFIRLSLSNASFQNYNAEDGINSLYGIGNFEPVVDASVQVIENSKNIYFFDNNNLNIEYSEKTKENGYYWSKALRIEAGQTYTLKINWQNKEYASTCYVQQVPKIDTVTFELKEAPEIGKDKFRIPYIWFKDNTETKDYYLFLTNNIGNGVWSRAILDDEFLAPEIKGIDVFKGESILYWRNAYPLEYDEVRIEMHSISKEIYEYYKALIGQFRNDGGIYTPSPASPPTNISNGALGFFRVSTVQVYEVERLPYPL